MKSSRVLFTGLLTLALLSGTVLSAAWAEESLLMLNIAPETGAAKAATAKVVQAKVLIKAPPSLVWQTITDYPRMKTILPGYEKSDVLKSSGPNKTLGIAMKVAPFLPTYQYQVQVRENQPAYQISLNRISGDFKTMRAVYQLQPQPNGSTILAYTLTIDPGFSLPGDKGILKASTEKSLHALDRYIEQEARNSRIGQR